MATQATTSPRITLRCATCGTWNRLRADRMHDGPKCGSCSTALPLGHPVLLDDETFDRAIAESELPVLVDFYADWCGPCHMMAPAVDALAQETLGRAVIAKLDTDRAPRTSQRFQIRGIPTSIVFREGREIRRTSGAVPLATLRGMLR